MEYIKIRGARTHNLKNISLDLPRNQLVVITGTISEQTKVEAALEASVAHLRAIVDISGIMLSVTDNKGRYLLVNDAYAQQLGYSVDELLK